MQNFRSNGSSIQLIAPAGGVVGGQTFSQGSIVGVVVADAAEGQQFTLRIAGEYEVKKLSGSAWAIGDKIYYDAATGNCSKDNTKEFAGYASLAAASGDVLGSVILK